MSSGIVPLVAKPGIKAFPRNVDEMVVDGDFDFDVRKSLCENWQCRAQKQRHRIAQNIDADTSDYSLGLRLQLFQA